ncbi:Ephrin Type-A Receptor 8 [Manis pentadactyla]|nr:Ephrin Type-A Receptor 8 [Manis pentadactyla]
MLRRKQIFLERFGKFSQVLKIQEKKPRTPHYDLLKEMEAEHFSNEIITCSTGELTPTLLTDNCILTGLHVH